MRLPLLLGTLLLLACCQPLPHPFAADAPPPGAAILTPRDGAGVAVEPVRGVPGPLGAALAGAMATALQDTDVPASAVVSNKVSDQLLGTASEKPGAGGQVELALLWELRDHKGATIGTHRQWAEVAGTAWRDGDPKLLARLAKEAAPPIAGLLQEKGTLAVAHPAPEIAVARVVGAPGDGAHALAQAMREVLRRQRIAVAEEGAAKADRFTIAGTVALAPAAAGKQRVRVTWTLFDPKGAQIGQVKQENTVAAGSLDGPWGAVAYAVAEAAASGIRALLDRAEEAPTPSDARLPSGRHDG